MIEQVYISKGALFILLVVENSLRIAFDGDGEPSIDELLGSCGS